MKLFVFFALSFAALNLNASNSGFDDNNEEVVNNVFNKKDCFKYYDEEGLSCMSEEAVNKEKKPDDLSSSPSELVDLNAPISNQIPNDDKPCCDLISNKNTYEFFHSYNENTDDFMERFNTPKKKYKDDDRSISVSPVDTKPILKAIKKNERRLEKENFQPNNNCNTISPKLWTINTNYKEIFPKKRVRESNFNNKKNTNTVIDFNKKRVIKTFFPVDDIEEFNEDDSNDK